MSAPATQKSGKFDEERLAQVLVGPIISEKATMVGEKRNQVLFKVLRNATKPEIKAAVELMFKVEVAAVQTVVQKGKVVLSVAAITSRRRTWHSSRARSSTSPGRPRNGCHQSQADIAWPPRRGEGRAFTPLQGAP